MIWHPIIKGYSAAPYREKLSELAEVLFKNIREFKSTAGISGDRLGVVLFLFYYARFTGEDRFADTGYQLLSELFDDINDEMERSNFTSGGGGLAGIGWVMEHLAGQKLLEIDTDEILGDIDPFIGSVMIADVKESNFELLSGALAKGLYYLNRLHVTDSRTALAALADELEKVCVTDKSGGFKVYQTVLDEHKREVLIVNPGMTNGLAGIVVFLSMLYKSGIAPQMVLRLLKGFTATILSHEQDPEQHFSYFPSWVLGESYPSESRLAWCYGDLGIGVALLQAARNTGDETLERKSLQVLLATTRRRELERNGVVDAGLCHGTAGIGHIYNRLYHYTGRGEFLDSARYWFGQTLEMATFDDGYAGFKCWKGNKMGGWHNTADLLDGISGIGLSLLSAISEVEPAWDRVMLLS